MKKIAILQSNYIPWKGQFDLIDAVDEFILYDDMQYTRRDWRNRNCIKTAQGLLWLTIPVKVKGKFDQRICDVEIEEKSWAKKHWSSIRQNYAKAAHFKQFEEQFAHLYEKAATLNRLVDVNSLFLRSICDIFAIKTKITSSLDYGETDLTKTARLVYLCQKAQANFYLSGPAAKDYIIPELFWNQGIEFAYANYAHYPEYKQLYGDFAHNVSVLDLLFNVGEESLKFLKGPKKIIGPIESQFSGIRAEN